MEPRIASTEVVTGIGTGRREACARTTQQPVGPEGVA